MPRRALLVALLLMSLGRVARADDAADAKALLDTLSTSASKDERVAAAAKLAEIGGRVIAPLGEFLKRPHETTPDQRRALLRAIKASVPDKNGTFQSPGREKASQIRADDEFDWFAALVELPPQPGLGEVIADDAAIRALSASKQTDAAQAILDTAFAADTMVYRDECGRYLRKMAPYSVPALIAISQSKKDRSKQRYANYQLERMDRQEPARALAAASDDEDLLIAVIGAFEKAEHREAVVAVVQLLDSDAPRVRTAARSAWMAYLLPPHPPAAPKKKLKMTGGEESDKPQPLWLNSRELARIETDRVYDELFHEQIDGNGDEAYEAAAKRIFAHYDQERAGRDSGEVAAAKAKADGGDLAGAIAAFDRLIAADPQRAERAEMAPYYYAYAEQLAGEEKWSDAAAEYSKAHGLAPEGEKATDALAAHYFALGKAEVAEGKDGSAAFRKAVELRPDYAEAKQAEKAASSPGKPGGNRWMLYVAAAVALGAIALLAMGLVRKQARP